MSGTTALIVMIAWLGGSSLTAAWALHHFWRTGHPAPTATIMAASAAVGFYLFIVPRVRGVHFPLWLFNVFVIIMLSLSITALLVPMIAKRQRREKPSL